MSNLVINEVDVVVSTREEAVYNALAAYSNAINQLMKTESTKSFAAMLPVPKVFGNYVDMVRKTQAQEEQMRAAQAKQAASAEALAKQSVTPSEGEPVDVISKAD